MYRFREFKHTLIYVRENLLYIYIYIKRNSDENVLLTHRPCLNFSTATGPSSLLSKSLCIESDIRELIFYFFFFLRYVSKSRVILMNFAPKELRIRDYLHLRYEKQ